MRASATQHRYRRAGLTLAELSVSLAVIATLMVAIGSIMVLTGQAVGMTAGQAEESRVDDVVATIASEQRMALMVTERTETSVTFTVADRDDDGINERIQYFWAGKDQPLMRKVNDEPAVVVLPKVEMFRLAHMTKSASPPAPVGEVETTSDELVFVHENGGTAGHAMTATAWCAQAFVPKLGRADATSFSVTRVEILAMRASGIYAAEGWTVTLCRSDLLGKPNLSDPVAPGKTLWMSDLNTSYGWEPITFDARGLNPSQRYWVVISQTLPAVLGSGTVSYDPSSSDSADPFANTPTAGNWSLNSGRDMKIRVYGRYKYPAP